VVPYDMVLVPAVLVRWLARTVMVLAATAVFAVAAAGAGAVGGRPVLVASIVGLLLTAALAALRAGMRKR